MNHISLSNAASLLNQGMVGVIPTDTVYGLAAKASRSDAVSRLYALKQRENKPGTIIAASVDQLVELGIKRRYLTAVEQFWPNPLSIVTPTGAELTYLHQGKGSLAIRIPDDPALRAFLEQCGPLVTSSANQPGDPPAVTSHDAHSVFADSVDFYVDGGDLSGRDASTVIRIVDDAVEILRQGALSIDESGRITR